MPWEKDRTYEILMGEIKNPSLRQKKLALSGAQGL
jgi:hypothetical protein